MVYTKKLTPPSGAVKKVHVINMGTAQGNGVLLAGDGCVIFWDIDGTLVENPDGDEDLFRTALLKTSPGLKVVESQDRHGKTDARIINDYLTANKLPVDEYVATMREALNAVSYNFFTSSEGRGVISGAKRAVEVCASSGFVNAILTGNSEQRAGLKLASAGFPLHLFNWEVSEFGDEEVVRTRLAEKVVEKKQLNGWNNVTIVGDTPADIVAARNAGVQCYAVATGAYSVEELEMAGAPVVVQNLSENLEGLILYAGSENLSG